MSPSGKTYDDGMRGLLRDRFEDFEPEAPELFDTIAGPRHTAAKRTVNRLLPLMISALLLMPGYRLNELSSGFQDRNIARVPAPALPAEPAAGKATEQTGRGSEWPVAIIPGRDAGTGGGVIAGRTGLQDRNPAGSTVATQENIIPARTFAREEFPALQPPAMKRSSGSAKRTIAAASGAAREKQRVKERPGRLSVHGALGVNYTQYLLTVLPQENLAIDNLTLADPGDAVNWRLQGSLGIDYNKWQLRLSYQEFTQKLSFLENRGNSEVSFADAGHYTVTPVAEQASSEKSFRVAGLYLRRLQPVQSTGLYVGAGAGYLAGLKGEHQGVWGQVFAGHSKRLSPTMDFFYETQFNYSFRPFRLDDPSLTFRPYQVGLSAGIRWNRK